MQIRQIVLWVFLTSFCVAQTTITPLNQTFKNRIKDAEFSLKNEGYQAQPVTLEIRSLALMNGKPTMSPLSSTTQVTLSDYSARLGPKSTHSFGVKAQCSVLPCAFVVLANVSQGHTDNGLGINLQIGTVFYLCANTTKGCREHFIGNNHK